MTKDGKWSFPDDPVFWIIDIAGTLLSILLTCAVTLRLRALQSGKQPSVAENLSGAAARWLPAVVATLLAALPVSLGLAALLVPGMHLAVSILLIPGIYLAICMVVLLPVVLFEPVGPLAALVRSFRLVRPIWVKVFACTLIAGLTGMICLLVLTIVMGLLFGAIFSPHLAQAALQAITLGAVAIFYVFVAALSLTVYTAASSSA
jgi:hypothetical protein